MYLKFWSFCLLHLIIVQSDCHSRFIFYECFGLKRMVRFIFIFFYELTSRQLGSTAVIIIPLKGCYVEYSGHCFQGVVLEVYLLFVQIPKLLFSSPFICEQVTQNSVVL